MSQIYTGLRTDTRGFVWTDLLSVSSGTDAAVATESVKAVVAVDAALSTLVDICKHQSLQVRSGSFIVTATYTQFSLHGFMLTDLLVYITSIVSHCKSTGGT